MGKGKGAFERKVIRIFRGDILIQFTGFRLNKLRAILKKFNKKLDIKLTLIYIKHRTFPLWFKLHKYDYFYEKYF